jgi:hypothetical protein
MTKGRWIGLIAVLAAAFASGALFNEWRAREWMKTHYCTATYWSVRDEALQHTLVEDRACLKLGSAQQYSGTWIDNPYSEGFVADRPARLPKNVDLSLLPSARAQIYSLAGVSAPTPEQEFSGKAFHVVVRGRFGTRDCCWTDIARNRIVVDEVISARLKRTS